MPEDKTAEQILEEQKANCPFCKIVKGDFPSKKVYEDSKILAVLDINPACKGHTLVLPKEHYPIITMIPEELFNYLIEKSAEIAKCIEDAMLCKGIEIFIASGGAAGQQVPHFMLHLVPRDSNDGLDNFELKHGAVTEEQVKGIKSMLEQGMASVMGKKPKQEEMTKEKLILLIEKSPQLKEAILTKTDEFKKMVEATPQLQMLFKKFTIDEIADEMKKLNPPEKKKEEKPADNAVEEVKQMLGKEKKDEETEEEDEDEKEESDEDKEPKEEPKQKDKSANLDLISKLFK
jgi:histidine triad (HIT) family protein